MRFFVFMVLFLVSCVSTGDKVALQQATSILDYCEGPASLAYQLARLRDMYGMQEHNLYAYVNEENRHMMNLNDREKQARFRVLSFVVDHPNYDAEESAAVMRGNCVVERKNDSWFKKLNPFK